VLQKNRRLTTCRLCMHPDNRPFFMKGPAEGLVGVCIRAAQQENVGSGGRAAALEALAGLALAPENQASLLSAPGVVAMAVQGAVDDNSRVKEVRLPCILLLRQGRITAKNIFFLQAGLNLIAALALLPANRPVLFGTPNLCQVCFSSSFSAGKHISVPAGQEKKEKNLSSALIFSLGSCRHCPERQYTSNCIGRSSRWNQQSRGG